MTTPATLAADLKAATAGSVLRLEPGAYRGVRIGALGKSLILAASDPENPPRFTGGAILTGASDLTFRSVVFDIPEAAADFATALTINGGARLAFEACGFQGRVMPETRWGKGLTALNVEGLTIRKCWARDLYVGMAVATSGKVEITDNDLADLGSDGIDFAGCLGLLIARNRIIGFHPVTGYHPDGIQGMQPGASRGSQDVVIEDNLIRGNAQGMQVIAENKVRMARVAIRRNVILDCGYNGIMAAQIDGVDVAGNVLLLARDGLRDKSWVRVEDCTSASATDNRAMGFIGQATQAGNVAIPKATPEQLEAAVAGWVAIHRPSDEIARLTAELSVAKDRLAQIKALAE